MIFLVTLEEGKEAVKIARRAIETYLETGDKIEPPENLAEEFREDRGVFVTLNKDGSLRGCIGRPLPRQTMINGLIDSAISAATRDPRFPSMDSEELDDVTVEVSILTVPEGIEIKNGEDCSKKIEIGRDGLIVKKGSREGLLLPQVPLGKDWDEKEFLSQTCVKAGLSPKSWEMEDVEIERFSAQVFKEESPGGEVVEEELSS